MGKTIEIAGNTYERDSWTNVRPSIVSKIGRNLHRQQYHPLNLIKLRIQNYFYTNFLGRTGNPIFAVFDNLNPVVSTYQNFDSLLVPKKHVSRSPSDSYYVNKDTMLRAHTSAHQEELIKMGFDSFLVVGDVYRRDEIDSTHYPIFHQMEGVRLYTDVELLTKVKDASGISLRENGKRTQDKQERHTVDASKLLEYQLKHTLLELAQKLFGAGVEHRWVDCYFPFTHPSWELEIFHNNEWLEVLGCGVMEQEILSNAGVDGKIGWAFGLGLERLAMKLFKIPDIRLFWSTDSGFHNQFRVPSPETPITYKAVSVYPQCINDISFWIPPQYTPSDFYDLVRDLGGELIEQVVLVDAFKHPKHQRVSHCYRLYYRHMEKTLTQQEVNVLHKQIEKKVVEQLKVDLR